MTDRKSHEPDVKPHGLPVSGEIPVPVEEAHSWAGLKRYAEAPDKPSPSTIAQIELPDAPLPGGDS